MSDYDRNTVRWGQGAAPARGAVDQGLRSYMLGVYNNMALGLVITGVVAYWRQPARRCGGPVAGRA